MKVGAIIQARMGASRLPGKVLMKLPYNSNFSVLEQIVRRVQKASLVDEVIIATSAKPADDPIQSTARKLKVKYVRGSESNVLARYYLAAEKNNLEVIVRIAADNPCVDPDLVNATVSLHLKKKPDYTATKNYPLGLNVEIISFLALKQAFGQASSRSEKEHVTQFIYKNPKKFTIVVKSAPQKNAYPDIRLTLDTAADYALLCTVFDYLYPKSKYFNLATIIRLFKQKPWLKLINQHISQKENSTRYI